MTKLFFGFILVLIAVGLGFLIQKDPGYILISYNQWVIETSLWVAIATVLISFIILYFFLRLIKNTSLLGERWHQWRLTRRQHKMYKKTHQALCELVEGYWQKAEKHLLKAAELNNEKLIQYLAAALSANKQGAYERRDLHLQAALNAAPDSELAVILTQAQLQSDAKQWEQALATLNRLQEIAPKHPYRLKLLYSVYLNLHEWRKLCDLLPGLSKQAILPVDELHDRTIQIYCHLIQETENTEQLDIFWNHLSRAWRQNLLLIKCYVEKLHHFNQDAAAIHAIESTLKKQWHPALVRLYSSLNDGSKQLITAEKWLKQHPQDPELLFCLGKLSLRERFLAKARDYLQQSMEIRPNPEGYFILGQVFEALGDQQSALNYYHKSK